MQRQDRMEIEVTPEEYDQYTQGFIARGLINPGEDPGLGLQKLVRRFLAKNGRPLLSPKTATRMAELETALDLEKGHGIAEALASDVLDQMMRGDFGLIQEGWDLSDREAADATMRRLAAQWKAEDAGKESA